MRFMKASEVMGENQFQHGFRSVAPDKFAEAAALLKIAHYY